MFRQFFQLANHDLSITSSGGCGDHTINRPNAISYGLKSRSHCHNKDAQATQTGIAQILKGGREDSSKDEMSKKMFEEISTFGTMR